MDIISNDRATSRAVIAKIEEIISKEGLFEFDPVMSFSFGPHVRRMAKVKIIVREYKNRISDEWWAFRCGRSMEMLK